MTSYFTASFLCALLPVAVLLYGVTPRRLRWGVLLAVSYLFIWRVSGWGIVFVWASTVSVYVLGRLIGCILHREDAELVRPRASRKEIRARTRRRVYVVLALGVALNVGILVVLRHTDLRDSLMGMMGSTVPVDLPSLSAPVGISFYTLMAVSYLADVSRRTIEPDRNLGHVALYLCFFPCIMEGPIVRYADVSPSLWEGGGLRAAGLYAGSLRMLVGLAKKLIVADRLNPAVAAVFDGYASLDGLTIAAGAALYTLQLYCDFAGTMDMALGMATLFGIRLPENFRQPFFSASASEFWQRWHITLGAWFRDYVYYPISLSRPMKALVRRARRRIGPLVGPMLVGTIALYVVWLGNGLWHGAATQYVAFGLYYFAVISLGRFVEPLALSLTGRIGVSRDAFAYRALRVVRTLCIVVVGELIFRSSDVHAAADMLWALVTRFPLDGLSGDSVLVQALDVHDWHVVFIVTGCVLALDLVKEVGLTPWQSMSGRSAPIRWGVWVALFVVVMVFGAYGAGYAPVDPMYARY